MNEPGATEFQERRGTNEIVVTPSMEKIARKICQLSSREPKVVGQGTVISLLTSNEKSYYSTDGNLRSFQRFRIRLLEELGGQTSADQASIDRFISWLSDFPDPELKLRGVEIVRRIARKSKLTNPPATFATPFETAVWSYASSELADFSSMEVLKRETLYQEATEISDKTLTVVEEKSFAPFIRLFVLRRIYEEISKGNLPTSEDESFVGTVRAEITQQLAKFGRKRREATYEPLSPTVGFEIQPESNPNRSKNTLLTIDKEEVPLLVKYSGFFASRDKPFEFVLPPSRLAITQLLCLREILIISGIPIQEPGIQLNFGGLGRIYQVPLVLQRVIFSLGELFPNRSLIGHGDYWDNTSLRLNPATKGEISIRERGSALSGNNIIPVNPPDPEHPEFSFVSELRASFGAKDFRTFAKGVLRAYRLASMAKAFERVKLGEKVSEKEAKMASQWEALTQSFDSLITGELHFFNQPSLSSEWTAGQWERFLLLTQETQFKKKSNEILQTFLRGGY